MSNNEEASYGEVNGSQPELLSHYVKRVIQEKRLSLHDVELLSGRKITDAYVGNIINGKAKNLTVEKLRALARGLRLP